MDWLLAPIDPSRTHDVGFFVSWHARSMVLAWVVLAPLAVLVARFFKIMPGQDWPRELDNQFWWRFHWIGHSGVALLSVIGFGLILGGSGSAGTHGRLGYALLLLMGLQVLLGVFRGSKGGPTSPARDGSTRGDHYDMTRWRVAFEWCHKLLGYAALAIAVIVVLAGLWQANAPRWMWVAILAWWLCLVAAYARLQRRGQAIDTYQAIWGPDPSHPGNRRAPIGWGIRRKKEDGAYVRSD